MNNLFLKEFNRIIDNIFEDYKFSLRFNNMSKNSLPNGVAAVPEKVPMQVPVKKDLKINTVKLFKPTDDVSRDSSDFVTNSLFIYSLSLRSRTLHWILWYQNQLKSRYKSLSLNLIWTRQYFNRMVHKTLAYLQLWMASIRCNWSLQLRKRTRRRRKIKRKSRRTRMSQI